MTATQEGVVTSARQEMLKEIHAARTEQIRQEIKDGGGDPDLLDATQDAQIEQDPADPPAADPAPQADPDPAAPVAQKVKIKVDGQEVEVELDKIIEAGTKTLQKETAADKRLEEAGRLKAEAEALVVAARTVQPQNQEQSSPPAGGPTVVEKLTDDNFISAVKAIQYGSEADAANALKALIASAAGSGQPEGLTVAQAHELLDFREATKWAHDEFKDVLGDPKLKSLFVQEEKRLRAAGDVRPYREVYADIGNGLREWRSGLTPAADPKPTPQSRAERKSTVVNIPVAAVRQSAPPQQKEATPSDVVDAMRKARHQA